MCKKVTGWKKNFDKKSKDRGLKVQKGEEYIFKRKSQERLLWKKDNFFQSNSFSTFCHWTVLQVSCESGGVDKQFIAGPLLTSINCNPTCEHFYVTSIVMHTIENTSSINVMCVDRLLSPHTLPNRCVLHLCISTLGPVNLLIWKFFNRAHMASSEAFSFHH